MSLSKMSSGPATRIGTVLLAIVALSCTDAVSTGVAVRKAQSAVMSEGAATITTMMLRHNGGITRSTVHRAASVLLVGDRVHLALGDTLAGPSTDSSVAHAAFGVAPSSAPRISKHFTHHLIASGKHNGRQINVLAIYDDNPRSGRPPQAVLTVADGQLIAYSALEYAKFGNRWGVVRTASTLYDSAGKPWITSVIRYSGGHVVGDAGSSSPGTWLSRAGNLATAALDALSPSELEAQTGPCDILYNLMIQAGAVAAERRALAIGLDNLCRIALVEDPDAAILVCADADLAAFQADNAYTDALLAQADYLLCMADTIVQLHEVVIIGTPNCYDYDVWVPDPDQEDMGWWETHNSCEQNAE